VHWDAARWDDGAGSRNGDTKVGTRDRLLSDLLSVINYIKTPQQYELFSGFQTFAYRELHADAPEKDRKVLEPVKPVVTR
jgi:hypothetical protein